MRSRFLGIPTYYVEVPYLPCRCNAMTEDHAAAAHSIALDASDDRGLLRGEQDREDRAFCVNIPGAPEREAVTEDAAPRGDLLKLGKIVEVLSA
jgi:hypothetical protein